MAVDTEPLTWLAIFGWTLLFVAAYGTVVRTTRADGIGRRLSLAFGVLWRRLSFALDSLAWSIWTVALLLVGSAWILLAVIQFDPVSWIAVVLAFVSGSAVTGLTDDPIYLLFVMMAAVVVLYGTFVVLRRSLGMG